MARRNFEEIAEQAGVSLATVSRVFSNHPNVREETRRKIVETAHRLNYAPKVAVGKRNIGVVFESLSALDTDSYLASMLATIARQLAARGFGIELVPMDELEKLDQYFIRAAIALPYFEKSIRKLEKCKRTGFVLLNAVHEGFSSVSTNQQQGLRLAYEHFLERGHRRIALFLDTREGWGNDERRAAFAELLRRHDGASVDDAIHGMDHEDIGTALRRVRALGVTALVLSSESYTLRAMSELQRLGVSVPDELSVISYENASVSPHLWPPHTTIAPNYVEQVGQAVEMAAKLVNDELTSPIRMQLDSRLILRESVRRLPATAAVAAE